MPSFLVNPKLNPALAARIAASVSGKRGGRKPESRQRSKRLWLRAGALLVLASVTVAVVVEVRSRTAALLAAKQSLLAERAALQQTLTPTARAIGQRLLAVIAREAGSNQGPVRHPSLASTQALDELLARPLLYARLDVAAVEPPDRLDAALAQSYKDAFVLCLRQPPAERTEKEMMKRVADALGRTGEALTLNVHRAHDALLSLRVLDPALDRQIENADELALVQHHRHLWDEAHVEQRLPAVFGEVLVAILDDAKTPDTPVELDGASVHRARVVVVDISRENAQVLLRSHFDLNPSWVSERRRHQYAQNLEGCRMAYDVRAGLAP